MSERPSLTVPRRSSRLAARTWLLIVGLIAAVVLGGGAIGVLTAPSASAAQYTVAYTDGDGVAVRSAPTADSKLSPLVVLPDGTGLDIVCQQMSSDGSAVGPRSNRVFDKVFLAPLSSSDTWVPDAYVSGTAPANTFTAGIPRCDQQSNSSSEFTPQPDLGIYCALKKPIDDGFAFSYRFYGSYSYGDEPTCTYAQISDGDVDAYLPAFWVPKNVPGDWGEACRLTYGPGSWAEKSGSTAVCHNVDMGYYEHASAQALNIVNNQ